MLDQISEPVLVALFGLLGGVLLGLAARIGHFCTLGAVEDATYGASTARLRMWILAIGIAIVGVQISTLFGIFDASATLYHQAPFSPLLHLGGGALFGYGMAMAGNCGFGALARLAGGDFRSLVIVLVMGVIAYVTLSGPLAVARLWLVEMTSVDVTDRDFAGLLGRMSGLEPGIVGSLIGLAIVGAALSGPDLWRDRAKIGWGALVGLAIVSGWIGTAYVAANGFQSMPVVSHTFTAPAGETILYVMTSSAGGLSFGIGSVAGVVLGALLGAVIKGRFRWEACEDPRELQRQILGAVAMGIGAVLALGCTIGQGISAFAVLSFGAPLTFAGILIGATLGLRWLISGRLLSV